MYNAEIPARAELPSTRQLLRSTLIAAASAAVLLCAVVLPSEYGVDPTGIGRVLGLTEMGEIKVRLAREAAEVPAVAEQRVPAEQSPVVAPTAPDTPAAATEAGQPTAGETPATAVTTPDAPVWRDTVSLTLAPGQGTEIKLKMEAGAEATYAWHVEGGVVNFDTHGDAPGRSISYEKGRAVANDDGKLVAAFTGQHGWFWRNRGKADVTLVLQTGGAYSELKRLK